MDISIKAKKNNLILDQKDAPNNYGVCPVYHGRFEHLWEAHHLKNILKWKIVEKFQHIFQTLCTLDNLLCTQTDALAFRIIVTVLPTYFPFSSHSIIQKYLLEKGPYSKPNWTLSWTTRLKMILLKQGLGLDVPSNLKHSVTRKHDSSMLENTLNTRLNETNIARPQSHWKAFTIKFLYGLYRQFTILRFLLIKTFWEFSNSTKIQHPNPVFDMKLLVIS